jgi:cytochrome c-type biogenesis protein
MILAGAGSAFAHAADGNLLLALPVALLAGLVSFLSPCVLPLVPAYLSYVTGLSAADLAAEVDRPRVSDGPGAAVAHAARPATAAPRGRVLLGSVLFVLGFSVVLIGFGATFGELGGHLLAHQTAVNRVGGVIAIVMGLAFVGLMPLLQREWRVRVPALGVAGAPLMGLAFGVGWTPCTGPTLGAVVTLAAAPSGATAARGAVLLTAYCAGLGIPFVLAGLGFRRAMSAFDVVKRHYRWVVIGGGALLIVTGVLLVTGEWTTLNDLLREHLPGYTAPV